MKKAIRKRNQSNATNNATTEEKTMKKAIRKRNQSNATNNALQAAQILAALDPAILKAIGLTPAKVEKNLEEKTSEASGAKSQKADRTYEIPSIGADFVKSGIYARPTSEDAARYFARVKALCSDVIENLSSQIVIDIKTIADRAEKNGGATLKNDLMQLADCWEIPAQSMRIIMQLCAPVVGVCNPETDEIARRVYGMARANALMGSACNTLMYNKAVDKDKALPFKRTTHNCTSLGLDFVECDNVEDCDFCDNDEDFNKLVTLCDVWLAKCKAKNPAPKNSTRRAQKLDTPVVEDKSAQILAALQALLK